MNKNAIATLFAACTLLPLHVCADNQPAPQAAAPSGVRAAARSAVLENAMVRVRIDLAAGSFAIVDVRTGETVLSGAGFGVANPGDARFAVESESDITDELGKGRRIVLSVLDMDLLRRSDYKAHSAAPPSRLITMTLHEGSPALILGFGLKTTAWASMRLMDAAPLSAAQLFPGKKLADPLTLNGGAGADLNLVMPGTSRRNANSLLLTGLVDGKRRSVVWGGLANGDFGKFVAIKDGAITATAEDPVGRLVPPDTTYIAPDSVYVDAVSADPFEALERYGLAMRAATGARPNVYDFPVLCGWSVGHVSKLPGVNTSAKLVEQLEAGIKAGIGKYTKVGVRLEPDKYLGDSEQGWWDDAHWQRYGHLVPPYTTVASWSRAVTAGGGAPYIYFQLGMPSDDFATAHPDWMLFNDISALGKKHRHHQPYVTYDYTDKGFSEHVVNTWKRLRAEGVIGVKFDYPETAWRPEGGFDDRYATTNSAYRRAFALVREGFGPDGLIDERNIGESGRPMLDVTAGIVDTQRTWTDSNQFVPGMVTISGLRWYKNRTVFNYYPDTKTVHDLAPEVRRAMLTMVFLSSGRFDMATSYSLFTPEMTHDFTRVFPHYREPKTARPVDAFTGVRDPQVYDLALTPDWHQVALFNTGKDTSTVSTAIAGEVAGNALGLDPGAHYHAYEFWSDSYLGKLSGQARLQRTLAPLNAAMISLRKVQPNPQVLSTNRHLLQGWVELSGVAWNAAARTLSGTAKVIGGEPFRIVVARNGATGATVAASGAAATLAAHPTEAGLDVITLNAAGNADASWTVTYGAAKHRAGDI